MDVANELLDAIEIIVDKKVRENTAQIYLGICKSVSGGSCVMSINGKDNTIQFYGSIPTVGAIYRVFVPDGNMSMAFAITGNDDRKGLQYSNPNLLDNWYFGNPINQRGQTSYTGAVYTIDRWIFDGENASMLIEGSGLHFVFSASATGIEAIHQRFENPGRYSGKAVTYSMLGSTNHSFGMLLLVNGSIFGPVNSGVLAGEALLSYTAVLPDNITSLEAYYYPKNASGTGEAYLRGCKLELGTKQTLAHQDENGNWVLNEIPDYGEQLARCQRYFQLYSSADLRPAKAVDCRPTMRADPAQSTIVVNSTTYYYNTADL